MAVPTTLLWDRDPHTAAKHALLDRYLAAWYPIMSRQFKDSGITFADGFAGPGAYLNSSESSPVIAMRHALRADVVQHGTSSRLVFVEEQADRAAHLRTVLEATFPSSERPHYVTASVTTGSCESELLPRLTALGAWKGPIFANLDGWGVDTPFAVVERVGQQRSSEVLVTFQSQWFSRFANLEDIAAGDLVFGDTLWRAVADQASVRKKAFLVTEYRRRLATAGFRYTMTFELLDEVGHSLFLVFGTTSTDGLVKMKDAVWTVDPIGGTRYRDPRDPDQLTFAIDEPDFTPLRRTVIDRLRAGPASLADLRLVALVETIYKPVHVKDAVDRLVKDTIVRRTQNGKSYAEKVFALTNDGAPLPQQGSLFG